MHPRWQHGVEKQITGLHSEMASEEKDRGNSGTNHGPSTMIAKDEINVPITLSVFRDKSTMISIPSKA